MKAESRNAHRDPIDGIMYFDYFENQIWSFPVFWNVTCLHRLGTFEFNKMREIF